MLRGTRVLGICAACAFLITAPGAAQTTGDAAGAIDGTVFDHAGGALPHVLVRVTGPALMVAREDVSRADGFYRIPALPPGHYVIAVTRAGFQPASRRDVRVRSGGTTTVPITLDIEAVREELTIDAGVPAIDRRVTTRAAVMDGRALTTLPAARTVGAILGVAPAVQLTGLDVGGHTALAPRPFSAYGIAGYNRPTLDGINISQHQRYGFHLDYGAFEEAWIGLGAYGAEWPSPGVHLQVRTKSGGDRYRGSLYAGYQHGRWQAHNVDEAQIARGATGGAGASAREANRLGGLQDLHADAGGFLLRSRWWWHASVQDQRIMTRPVSPRETAATGASLKTTVRTGQHGTIVLFAHPAITRQPNHPGAFLRPEGAMPLSRESTTAQVSRGLVWGAGWSGVLGREVFADARAGQFAVHRSESPNGVSPRVEDLVSPEVRGGGRTWREDLQRTQASGSVSHLREGRAGRHHLRAGGDVVRTLAAETWYRSYPGDVLHVLRNGTPAEVYLFQAPSQSVTEHWWYSAFLSDSWQTTDRLTLNAGVRYDRHRFGLPAQRHPAGRFTSTPQPFPAVARVAAWNVVAPRIGVSADLRGDGRTVVKGSYGLYWLPPGTELGFNVNPNARVWWERYVWNDRNADGLWQPGEQGAVPLDRRGGTALESLDPGLELAYVREATAFVEQESGPLHVSTGVVWRAERQQGARQLSHRTFDMFAAPAVLRDPGPDGTTLVTMAPGPAIQLYELVDVSGGPPDLVVRNVPDSDSDYTTWEVTAGRRLSGRWSLVASVEHTWHRDHAAAYLGQMVRANEYPVTPNDLIHTDPGGRHVFRTWSAKAYGTFDAPWGLRLTPLLRHQSGQPYGRTVLAPLNYGLIRVLAEPVGTRRQDHITLVDLSVQKDLPVPGDRRVSAFVQVFNLLNANPEQQVSWASGPAFQRPLSIVPPRIARVGLRVDW